MQMVSILTFFFLHTQCFVASKRLKYTHTISAHNPSGLMYDPFLSKKFRRRAGMSPSPPMPPSLGLYVPSGCLERARRDAPPGNNMLVVAGNGGKPVRLLPLVAGDQYCVGELNALPLSAGTLAKPVACS